MIKPSTKLKRGTEMIYQGKAVWVEYNRSDNKILIRLKKVAEIADDYEVVEPMELQPITKARTPIQSKPKKLTEQEKGKRDDMNDFFDKMAKIPFNCQECGRPLYAVNKFAKRSVCCHILPKSKFPSVATVEDNILFMGADFLGICDHHDKWDSCVENRTKMRIYQNAIFQFEKFKHLLTDKELIDAHDYLNINK